MRLFLRVPDVDETLRTELELKPAPTPVSPVLTAAFLLAFIACVLVGLLFALVLAMGVTEYCWL